MMLATLARLALRNAKRHRAQAMAAAAAVAVGTTVLAAALSAGQAAESGITQVAFDILDETDELVHSEGEFYFLQEAAADFAREVRGRRSDLAVGPAIVHGGIAGTPDGLTEPGTMLVGFPAEDPGFGSFVEVAGAVALVRGRALINEDLAHRIDAAVGDIIEFRFARPVDPVVPTVLRFPGNVTSVAPRLPLGDPGPIAATFEFEVGADATRIIAVLVWGSPQNAVDLDLSLSGPDGQFRVNLNGTAGSPDAPAILNATAEPGTWRARVFSQAAVNQPFRLFVIVLRPAFAIEELREAREQLEALGPLGESFDPTTRTELVTLTVAGIVAREGKGGFFGSPAIFVPLEDAQRMLGRPLDVNLVRVGNPGGAREGLSYTAEVLPVLRDALNATKGRFPEPSVEALKVEPTKREIVDRAEEAGTQFSSFLATLSSFTIMAGVLLVVNLFTMLGEERRVELAVMRALGMRRRHLVGSLAMEGTLYALPGAPVGALLGIALAWALIRIINDFVASQDQLPIPFIIEPWTLFAAAAIGLAFTILAVTLTGVHLSRLHIASGLKGLHEARRARGARLALVLILVGAVVSALYVPTGFYTTLVLGPAALLYGGALVVGRRWTPHKARFLGAALVIPYGLWTVVAFTEISTAEAPIIAPLRGTLLVVLAVIFMLNFPGLPRALKGLARRTRRHATATMVALAYPTTRPLRTGLTASMFALVLLVLAVFSTFFGVFQVDPEREAGGYDIYAETPLPVESLDAWATEYRATPAASLRQLQLVDKLVTVTVVGGDVVTIEGERVAYQGPPVDYFYGIDEDFARHNGYTLASRAREFATDAEAYLAIVADPDNVVVSRAYDADSVGRLGVIKGGETLTMDLASGTRDFRVLGAQEQFYLGGIFMERRTLIDLFPTHGTGFLIQVRAGEDPVEVARALERDFRELGLDVESIRAEALRFQELNARFFSVLQVFLGLGLIIGVASLGIVTAKSAIEREHELGVLRALGLPSAHVTWTLVVEAMFTAVLGIVPGIFIGVAVAYAAFLAFFADAGVPFSVPWASILWLSLISLVATLLSTVPPARRAARTDLARAVRVQL